MKKVFLLIFIIIFIAVFSVLLSIPNKKTPGTRSKAAGNTVLYPQEGSITDIQSMIDSAKDGDTITIPPGSYLGGTAIPINSNRSYTGNEKGGSDTCFVRIEKKNITIIGRGVTFYGEGHAKPYQDPYQNRAGVCVLDSNVTFDGLRIKEFQKRGMVIADSTIVYKNGVMDGCDEGGISLVGSSKAVILNNIFVGFNFGGIMLWQNAQAKIFNNLFHGANVMFFHSPNYKTSARADITNNIFTSGSAVTQVDWWTSEVAKLKTNNLSYNLIWYGDKTCGPNDFCDNYVGKVEADPLLNDAAIDPTGWVYGSLDLRAESPAVGKGDPSLPGPKNLGNSGGPCADGNSAACTSFIEQLKSSLKPITSPTNSVPTSSPYQNPTQPPRDENNPTRQPGQPRPTSSDDGPPITYYIPPTMSFSNPTRKPSNNTQNPTPGNEENPITPTITPTPKPLIDVGKTVENAKKSINNLWNSFINFTKSILP
ncbi:right-handed parallel beta-helix repeat-containing protein [Candidatus Gottesmanbacteria bacterium]|nr:right-handed parallel beta-helix repeat-containing protein [Candidatus Gottesmanbacteria bacterium]